MSDCSSSSEDEDLPRLVSRMVVDSSTINSDPDDEGDNDEEMDGEELYIDSLQPARDLFSEKTFRTAEECIDHCRNVHGLDLGLLKRRHSMDTFSYIRFVNYVRTERPSPGFVMSLGSDAKWAEECFLRPVLEDDPMLMYNFDEEIPGGMSGDGLLPDGEDDENGFEIDISRDLNDEIERKLWGGGGVGMFPETISQPSGEVVHELAPLRQVVGEESHQLQDQVNQLRQQLKEKEYQLELCVADMNSMRSAAQALFASASSSTEAPASKILDDRSSSTAGLQTVSQHKTVEEDHSYFQSYAHYSIHLEMLSDRVRTESYRDALLTNADSLISGRRVLDIGCGTGILSMFAAKAGAARVVGVDCSDILYSAMDIVRENGLAERIALVKGRLEETPLPDGDQRFDVIVSEWMGYFLLFEGMLDSVLAARDRYLAPGGTMLPNRCTLSLVAVSDSTRYDSLVGGFWSDVYGFQMSCMRSPILSEASVEVVPAAAVISAPATVLNLDINQCRVEDTEFDSRFTLTIQRAGQLTALVGYFDTYFELANPVFFSTGPNAIPTHWKQTVFYLPEKVAVNEGQVLNCRIVCKRMKTDARALKVALTVDDLVLRYTVD